MKIDDSYLIKLKSLGVSDPKIAAKLGVSVEEVNEHWQSLLRQSHDQIVNGYKAVCEAFNLLAGRYQLVGESMKTFGGIIGNIMTETEIRALIREDPEETVRNLTQQAIVLRVFVPSSKQKEDALPESPNPSRN